jgi:hypothetical protein
VPQLALDRFAHQHRHAGPPRLRAFDERGPQAMQIDADAIT